MLLLKGRPHPPSFLCWLCLNSSLTNLSTCFTGATLPWNPHQQFHSWYVPVPGLPTHRDLCVLYLPRPPEEQCPVPVRPAPLQSRQLLTHRNHSWWRHLYCKHLKHSLQILCFGFPILLGASLLRKSHLLRRQQWNSWGNRSLGLVVALCVSAGPPFSSPEWLPYLFTP